MTQKDISSVLAEAFEMMEPRHAPDGLLAGVFSVTRTTRQRSGIAGRLGQMADSITTMLQTRARPVVTFALLVALLALLLASAAFYGGWFRHSPPTGWRVLDADPAITELTTVNDVVSTPSGFVVAGATMRAQGDQCENDLVRGRVWTSVDGDKWVDSAGDSLVGVMPARLLATSDAIYMFGRADYCAQEEPPNARVWRSLNNGATWTLLPESEPFALGNVPTIVEVHGTLVASGVHQEPPSDANPGVFGEPEFRIWISRDAIQWENVFNTSDSYFGGLATNGESLVSIVSAVNEPIARLSYSTDLGRTWAEAQAPRFTTNSLSTVSYSNGHYVGIGQNVALSSVDGHTWTASTTEFGAGPLMSQLWAIPDGFMVSDVRGDGLRGIECQVVGPARPSFQVLPTDEPASTPVASQVPALPVPTETCLPVSGGGGGGGTWLSADGAEWKRGPNLPQGTLEAGGPVYFVAAGHDGVVVAELSHADMVWYAPLSDFRP